MAKESLSNDKKVMDVSKPGKGKVVATSRPVVAPMTSSTETPTAPEIAPPSVTRKVIQPLSPVNEIVAGGETPKKPATSIKIISDTPDDEEPVKMPAEPEVSEAAESLEAEDASEEKTEEDPVAADIDKIESEPETESTDKAESPAEEPVADEAPAEEPAEPEELAAAPVEKSPVIEEQLPDKLKSETKPEAQAPEPEPEPSTEETSAKPASAPAEPENSDTVGSDAASVNALAQTAETKKDAAKKAEEQVQKDAELQKLIDSHQYFVPIGAHHHKDKKGRRLAWFLVFLIVALIGSYLAVDAELVDIGLKLPYDLIK